MLLISENIPISLFCFHEPSARQAKANSYQVHVALDPRTGAGKGIAYIQYEDSGNAELAMSELDGKPFQGRLLHILPASAKREYVLDEYAISKLPIKTQKQLRRKAEAASTTFKWNSMYMNVSYYVVSSYHVTKSFQHSLTLSCRLLPIGSGFPNQKFWTLPLQVLP